MIYVDADYLEFAEKFKIEPMDLKCLGCGITLTTSVPIRIKGYAGLELPAHGCAQTAATFVPCTQDEITFWRSLND